MQDQPLASALSSLQNTGSSVGVQATTAMSNMAQAVRSTGEEILIDAAKHVVATLGVDSNQLNTATPGSQYGARPLQYPHS